MKYLNILIFLFLISYILATDLTTVTCTADGDCTTADKNSECKTGHCACVTKYVLNDDKDKCLPLLTEIACTADGDCTDADKNGKCSSGKCACAENYVMNDAKTQCLQNLSSVDCTSDATVCSKSDTNSECNSSTKKCVCKSGYKLNSANTACEKEETPAQQDNSCSFLSLSLFTLGLLF